MISSDTSDNSDKDTNPGLCKKTPYTAVTEIHVTSVTSVTKQEANERERREQDRARLPRPRPWCELGETEYGELPY